ncbi:MAG: HipA domain-containing protein [Polyangiaceae bacterium]|nr:HipA domain-containing protein [Polyangiaceae bacterium]
MDDRHLKVELYGQKVGTLVPRADGGARFTPDPPWVEREFVPRLGLGWDLRRGSGTRSSSMGLPAWFENLLPERGSLVRERIARQVGISETSSFALLQALGHVLPGAVIVGPDTDNRGLDSTPPDSDKQDPPQGDPAASEESRLSSLGGMQLKFSVSIRNDKVVWPLKGQDGDWLIKLATGNYPQLAEVEFATMAWARAVGFDVPKNKLARVVDQEAFAHLASTDEENAFLIQRYDRSSSGRIHQEDFAQVLEVMPEDKYGERARVPINHNGMARIVLDACGEAELTKYIERLVFVIVSGNTDAHFKNWSLLHPYGGRPILTPVYDQVCTISWPSLGWEPSKKPPKLALGIGKTRSLVEVDVSNFYPLARRVRQAEAWVEKLVLETVERCIAAWTFVEQFAPPRMRRALQAHFTRVPLLCRFASPVSKDA